MNEGNLIILKNNKIYNYNKSEKELIAYIEKIKDFSVCDNYLWINAVKESILFDLDSEESYSYNYKDGIAGKSINHLGCDDYWVWF